jgi:GNAT superfamily N-acetyltransferase
LSDLVCRPYRADDEPRLRDLSRAVYGPQADRRTSAWRYLAPAPWPAVIEIAEADGRIVGAQPSHGIDLAIAGAPVRGLLLLDVMTHPDYRRRGVFAGVVEGLRKRASVHGYRVLLTTPNADAERGFARLAAWRRLGELVPWVAVADLGALVAADARWGAVLRPVDALRQAISRRGPADRPGSADDHAGYPGDDFTDNLWLSLRAAAPVQAVRDARFVTWRFGSGSGRPYSFLTAGSAERPDALVVHGVGSFVGREVVTLADIMARPEAPRPAVRLLRRLSADAAARRRAAVVGWFAPGSPAERVLRAAGYRRVPKALRPRPYAIWGCSDLSGEAGARALDLRAWNMSLADSDLA